MIVATPAFEGSDMRASNEVVIGRLEFKSATAWTRRGKIGAQDVSLHLFVSHQLNKLC
jgi:hypothetical protein